MVQLETRAVICVTGNAIDVSEDLARRFIIVGLDAKLESPELRRFEGRFLDTIRERRSELMSAALTI
jgi:putative DNA primase/helicase